MELLDAGEVFGGREDSGFVTTLRKTRVQPVFDLSSSNKEIF